MTTNKPNSFSKGQANPKNPLTPKKNAVFRILHTADWHLGKMLYERDRTEEHQRFLDFLLASIKKEKIDALLIAGDIFDSPHPPKSAESLYFDFLASIHRETDCTVVVTGGNHDSPAHLEAPKQILKALDVHVVGMMPNILSDALIPLPTSDDPTVVIAALPYLRDRDLRTAVFGQSEEEIRRSLQKGIRKHYDAAGKEMQERYKDIAFIAMGHLTITGAIKSDSEREIQIGGLGAVPVSTFSDIFSYVALGHLHHPQKIKNEHIRYSGSPIPLSFSEANDKKEIRILDFKDGQLISNTLKEIPIARSLFQLRVDREDLESTLYKLELPSSALPPWIELIVDGHDGTGNLFEEIQNHTKNCSFEVVRVMTPNSSKTNGLSEEALNESDFPDLLNDPIQVFTYRLENEEELNEEDRKHLCTAFKELYDSVLESEKES